MYGVLSARIRLAFVRFYQLFGASDGYKFKDYN